LVNGVKQITADPKSSDIGLVPTKLLV